MGTLISPKYPAMERQDLTQGQLGSFKFTPVDAELRNSIYGETPMLWQAQEKLRRRLEQQSALEGVAWEKKSSPQKWRNGYNKSKQSSSGLSSQPPSPLFNPDHSLFNNYIKSDFDNSQLRMGTTALHSAVNGGSPERLHSAYQVNSQFFDPPPAHSRFMRSTMNPEASAFDPYLSSSDSSRGRDDVNIFNASLCRALQAEQQAHENTIEDLDRVRAKLHTLEIQFKSVVSENKSLTATVKALSAIIKHNENRIRKLEDEAAALGNVTISAKGSDLTDGVLASGFQTPNKKNRATTPSSMNGVDYDQTSSIVKQVSPESDHTKIFNLDMLKRGQSSDSQTADLSRALRKHFSVDEVSSVSSQSVKITVDNDQKSDKLVHISPQAPPRMAYLTGNTSIDPPTTKVLTTEARPAKVYETGTLWSAENDMPQLPASFLKAYTPKAKGSAQNASQKQEEDSVGSPTVGYSTPSSIDVEKNHVQDRTPTKAATPATIDTSGPLSLCIHWKVTRENPVFDDDELRPAYMGQPKRHGPPDVFWRHPLRFMEYGDKNKNIFRTVMIENIPINATYADVLEQIHGGSLEKIELVPAIGQECKYQTARVVFNLEIGASTTASFARDHGMKIKGKDVRVWQVLTPTYPKNDQLDREVFEDAYTRILLIANASEEAVRALPGYLSRFKTSIVEISYTFDNFPMIEFTSVAAATSAMRYLGEFRIFDGASYDFDDDYCDTFGVDRATLADLWGPPLESE